MRDPLPLNWGLGPDAALPLWQNLSLEEAERTCAQACFDLPGAHPKFKALSHNSQTVPGLRPEEYAGLAGTGVFAVVDVNCCEAHSKVGLI